jgi:Zn-finger nucleic acid-binding protein
MNCSNCGAAMELVESRRFFKCRHCGSFHFPTTVEADGIRVSGTPANALNCPVCQTPMAHAVVDDEFPVDFCTKCRGLLLPRASFATVTSKRRAWAASPPSAPAPIDRRELGREISCPVCGRRLQTYPHYGPGNVVIDNCTHCDVIWVDFGEMRQIVDAPGKDRGSRHVARADDDFVRYGPPRDDDDDHWWIRLRRQRNALADLFDLD